MLSDYFWSSVSPLQGNAMFIHISFPVQSFLESSNTGITWTCCQLNEQKPNFSSACMVQSPKSNAQQCLNLQTGDTCWSFVPAYFFQVLYISIHTYVYIQSRTYKKLSLSRRIQNFNTAMHLDIFIHFLNLYTIIYYNNKVGFPLFFTKAKTHVIICWVSTALASNLSWTSLYNQCRARKRSTPRR